MTNVMLNPSILNRLLPNMSTFLFPLRSLNGVAVLDRFNLVLFVFTVNVRLSVNRIHGGLGRAVLVDRADAVIPFFFNVLATCCICKSCTRGKAPFLSFTLFVKVTVDVATFPILTQVVRRGKLAGARLKAVSLTDTTGKSVAT